jgi:hypothetical protein
MAGSQKCIVVLETLNKLERTERAASAMLAALEEFARCGLHNELSQKAIAAAKAAGIKVEA